MHTCSCGAVFEGAEPQCRSWPVASITVAPFVDFESAKNTHARAPFNPGRSCRRLEAGSTIHHLKPSRVE